MAAPFSGRDGIRGDVELEFDFAYDPVGDRTRLGELERIREQNKQLEIHRLGLEIEQFREEQRKKLEIEAKPR